MSLAGAIPTLLSAGHQAATVCGISELPRSDKRYSSNKIMYYVLCFVSCLRALFSNNQNSSLSSKRYPCKKLPVFPRGAILSIPEQNTPYP